MTEPGLLGIPACMVMFDFDPDFNRSRVITLWSIRLLDPPSDAEDDPH